jgi:ApaG protein
LSELTTYVETTKQITVSVSPLFLDEQSVPDDSRYVWAYQVRIQNNSSATVQLLTRRWRIMDARGRTQEILGDGVVGEQPILEPDDFFEYTSGTPLSTPSGFMSGSFGMISETGALFDIVVPAFSLDGPDYKGQVH